MTALFHDIVVLLEAPETATARDLEDHALAALVAWRGTPEGLILPRVLPSRPANCRMRGNRPYDGVAMLRHLPGNWWRAKGSNESESST